jgi:hypothetical protein
MTTGVLHNTKSPFLMAGGAVIGKSLFPPIHTKSSTALCEPVHSSSVTLLPCTFSTRHGWICSPQGHLHHLQDEQNT